MFLFWCSVHCKKMSAYHLLASVGVVRRDENNQATTAPPGDGSGRRDAMVGVYPALTRPPPPPPPPPRLPSETQTRIDSHSCLRAKTMRHPHISLLARLAIRRLQKCSFFIFLQFFWRQTISLNGEEIWKMPRPLYGLLTTDCNFVHQKLQFLIKYGPKCSFQANSHAPLVISFKINLQIAANIIKV